MRCFIPGEAESGPPRARSCPHLLQSAHTIGRQATGAEGPNLASDAFLDCTPVWAARSWLSCLGPAATIPFCGLDITTALLAKIDSGRLMRELPMFKTAGRATAGSFGAAARGGGSLGRPKQTLTPCSRKVGPGARRHRCAAPHAGR